MKNRKDEFVIAAGQNSVERDYWINELGDTVEETHFPFDGVDDGKASVMKELDFMMPESLLAQVEKVSKGSVVKCHILWVTGVIALIEKYSRSRDITVGIPVYRQDLDGDYINSFLPIRTSIAPGSTFRMLLDQVQQRISAGTQNQNYPVDLLTGALSSRFFDIMIAFVQIHDIRIVDEAGRNFAFVFDWTPGHYRLWVKFNSLLFVPETVFRICHHLSVLLERMLLSPDNDLKEILPSSDEELAGLELFSHGPSQSNSWKSVDELFSHQAGICADRPVVVDGELSLTYREVGRQSDRIGGFLCSVGVKEEEVIGLCVSPGYLMLFGILGVLKSGCGYLPLDPQLPANRLEYILKDSGCRTILSDGSCDLSLFGDRSVYLLQEIVKEEGEMGGISRRVAGPEDLCYVIYTSGSTGTPKGVMITHGNVLNYSAWFAGEFELSQGDSSILTSSYSFDLGYSSFYPLILSGGTLHFMRREGYMEGRSLLGYVSRLGISYLKLTPTLFSSLVSGGAYREMDMSRLRLLLLGGERIVMEQVRDLLKAHGHIRVVNHYGPTETTIGVITDESGEKAFESDDRESVIGRPINNTAAFVMDDGLRQQPQGVEGEICIGGKSVGRGYLNAPELTARRYVWVGGKGRLYRTGDVGRVRADGRIEYRGRLDQEVKIRGHRVNLQEVERVLSRHSSVIKGVVLSRSTGGVLHLCCYVVLKHPVESVALREYMLQELPDYMVPTEIQRVREIPMLANGKIDQEGLTKRAVDLSPAVPENEVERMLADIWKQVLGREEISVNDNFFTIGGDSIKAIQMMSRIHKVNYQSELKNIFTYPSIRELAPRVTKKVSSVASQSIISGHVYLTPIQQFFFQQKVDTDHYHQSIMLSSSERLNFATLKEIFRVILHHHDALRMVFVAEDNKLRQINQGIDCQLGIESHDLRGVDDPLNKLDELTDDVHKKIKIAVGPLFRVAHFQMTDGDRLLVVIHHLVVDGISWRILLEDMDDLYHQHRENKILKLSDKTASFKMWAEKLKEYSQSPMLEKQKRYWSEIACADNLLFKASQPIARSQGRVTCSLDKQLTRKLLGNVHDAYNTTIEDLLLTALIRSMSAVFGRKNVAVELEGHGREPVIDLDVSRTVGWFTTKYPILLDIRSSDELSQQIKLVKESLHSVPDKGIGYGLLRYIRDDATLGRERSPDVTFNYLGQFDQLFNGEVFRVSGESSGNDRSKVNMSTSALDYSGMIREGELVIWITYDNNRLTAETAELMTDFYKANLVEIIGHCESRDASEVTPADLTFKDLSLDELDTIFDS